ncbi:hypothetical protein [Granulicoccus phenolivorans]|uniref:hypothetical protein n=1 Tax=Granulicoccus phenolivorans TaxID=266854 RepID=UPI000421A841|nr:hypothetical protein [Granulicoccus phenolivorans]
MSSITAVTLIPKPLLLLPAYASLADPAAELRAHCHAALAQVAGAGPEQVTVIAEQASPGFRVAAAVLADSALADLPVRELPVTEQTIDAVVAEVTAAAAGTALLVTGDGSARRDPKAPGHFDPRAAAFDAEVCRALAAPDPAALAALDAGTARELLAAGWLGWQVLARVLPDTRTAYWWADDPFGVQYAVATWLPHPTPKP